eukprot:7522614-Lingulodinium_polyedra.AAC.1
MRVAGRGCLAKPSRARQGDGQKPERTVARNSGASSQARGSTASGICGRWLWRARISRRSRVSGPR